MVVPKSRWKSAVGIPLTARTLPGCSPSSGSDSCSRAPAFGRGLTTRRELVKNARDSGDDTEQSHGHARRDPEVRDPHAGVYLEKPAR